MVDIKKFLEIDLYDLIGADITANETEIRKAYRRKALQCHPDKNPNNPKAAELFQQLSKALEVLLDVAARSAYDKVINARKAAEVRFKQLDSKRQKLKSELEAREKLLKNVGNLRFNYTVEKTPEELLQNEIERLRKEGSKLLEEEQEMLRKQVREETDLQPKTFNSAEHRVKIKWNTSKNDTENGGYNDEVLRKYLQKYGDIIALIVSSKKKGSALVEFSTKEASEMAILYEKGNLENPLKLEWLTGEKIDTVSSSRTTSSSTIKESDFESLVLRQLRQAEERKRLIEQMMKDEED